MTDTGVSCRDLNRGCLSRGPQATIVGNNLDLRFFHEEQENHSARKATNGQHFE